jgi:hypothetical protein
VPVSIALAAERLFKSNTASRYLVYGSSDIARRGAVVMEKHKCREK